MIMTTNTSAVIQCSRCGAQDYHTLSMFSFYSPENVKYLCSCGSHILSITSRDRKQFNVAFQCAFCGQIHFMRFKRDMIWGQQLLPLICPEIDVAAGFIGPKKKVTQACQESQRTIGDVAARFEHDEEFENPEVMLRILEHLRELAKREVLGCGCGNHHLSFDLFSDHIELYCELCEALGIIYATHQANIFPIEGMRSIRLEENRTWEINRQWVPVWRKK